MRRRSAGRFVVQAVFSLALTCVSALSLVWAQPAQLNSERIAQRFGSYGIDVIASDARRRIANLYSLETEGAVCRTFAVTFYPVEVHPAFAAEHAEILVGGSIGAVFADHGWQVHRRHLWIGELPPSERVLELMGDIRPEPLSVHVFELLVSRDDTSYRYATIAEVHHPRYLSVTDLRDLFGSDWRAGIDFQSAVPMLLATLEAMQ